MTVVTPIWVWLPGRDEPTRAGDLVNGNSARFIYRPDSGPVIEDSARMNRLVEDVRPSFAYAEWLAQSNLQGRYSRSRSRSIAVRG